MSRFVNLELGGESEDQTPQKKALVKDEAYYLSEARAQILKGRSADHVFVTGRGGGMTRQMAWTLIKKPALPIVKASFLAHTGISIRQLSTISELHAAYANTAKPIGK